MGLKVVFINATQHELTQEQKDAIKPFVERLVGDGGDVEVTITNLKDELPELYNQLSNIPYGTNTQPLIESLINKVVEIGDRYNASLTLIHFPIGSPRFMFEVAMVYAYLFRDGSIGDVYPIFSHTERKVVEEKLDDGSMKKVSVFKFNGYEIPLIENWIARN